MPGHWRRAGLIGSLAGTTPWALTHSSMPAIAPADDGSYELYASTRDADGRARIARCRFHLEPTARIDQVEALPVLDPGALGAFDDRGVTMSCVVTHGGAKYLYYTGWNLGVTVPFYLNAGLAVSDDGGATFQRISRGPVLPRDDIDPFLTASPFVLIDDGAWRMWYVSGTAWELVDGSPRHRYHIKYAESRDGVQWTRSGHVCIDYASEDEYAFARPYVRRDNGVYRMWYSYRGSRYRIGYAESVDGLVWDRHDDQRGLDTSAAGWDSEMVAYPWLLDCDDRTYMLYNGNGYGRTGIGLAVWEPNGDPREPVR